MIDNIKISNRFSIDYVLEYFSGEHQNVKYIRFHQIRYQYLINLIDAIIAPHKDGPIQILDIGPMHQTNLIRDSFPHVVVDTMGQDYPINKLRPHEQHIDIDLNNVEEFQAEPKKKYDILVFSEVLEHLYTRPEIVLRFLKGYMKKGGQIILQTPNGLAIHHRIKLLFGIHPYQLIKPSRRGHYREYAPYEMIQIFENVNLDIHYLKTKNYFNNDSTILNKLFVKSSRFLPPNWRDGITIIGQKD